MTPQHSRRVKIALYGECRIGKSAFTHTFSFPQTVVSPSHQYYPTIGFELGIGDISHHALNLNVRVELWDMSGDHRFAQIVTNQAKFLNVMVLCYDPSNGGSLLHFADHLNEFATANSSQLKTIAALGMRIGNEPTENNRLTPDEVRDVLGRPELLVVEACVFDPTAVDTAVHEIVDSFLAATEPVAPPRVAAHGAVRIPSVGPLRAL
jgi:GTPase SAR1 family protein